MEEWKNIPNYEGRYQASSKGAIRSLDCPKIIRHRNGKYISITKKGKTLSPSLSRGYLRVVLFENGKRKSKMVHQLVAMAFLNHVPNGHELVVDHKNYIKTDNNVDNLQLITPRENTTKDNFRYNYSSKYIGVSWNKNNKKWRTMIQIKGKSKFLGNFDNEYEAHLAYQKELKNLCK